MVAFEGNRASPYEDGIFQVEVKLPDTFPNTRPYLYFITKMFHPNINPNNGLVSLNLMYQWVPTRTIEQVFFGFLEVMENPKVGRGGGEAAILLAKDRNKYFEKVREYTLQFAMDDIDGIDEN